TDPYNDPDGGTLLTFIATALRAPGASVNERALTPTRESSVLERFGTTAPLRDCDHGRGVTVILSVLLVALTTVIDAVSPRTAVRSITAGVTDRPPSADAVAPASG